MGKKVNALLNVIFPVVDMNKPQKKREMMSDKQMYDYLVSSRNRTAEEQSMIEYLHIKLGKNKWD